MADFSQLACGLMSNMRGWVGVMMMNELNGSDGDEMFRGINFVNFYCQKKINSINRDVIC